MDNTEKTLQILTNATGTNTELLNIKVSPGVGDIVVQLDVFNEQNDGNKTSRQSSTNSSINLNSHLEVFQAIMEQNTKTSHEATFLNILLHLLRIDPNDVLSASMWKVAEKLLHRVVQVESSEDAQRLLKSTENHTFLCQYCNDKAKENEGINNNKIELPAIQTVTTPSTAFTLKAIPDLIPSAPTTSPSSLSPAPPLLSVPGLPPPPPLPPLRGGPPPPPNLLKQAQQNTPKPSKKLKICNWSKIPPFRIINKSNSIWSKVDIPHQYKCDYQVIEELFSAQIVNKTNKDEVDSKDKSKPIDLLNSQLSLQINIFLSQFKGYNSEDIVQLIRSGNNKVMDSEKLKDLIKFLQKEEDIEILKNFDGDRQRLANPEKFFILLLEVPNYKFRIECMDLKEKFALDMNSLVSSVEAILKAGKALMENENLPKILHIIITIGNFLNYGGFVGNATGITICSLNKISDTKANKPNMHLLHFIALEVERYNPDLLNFYKDFNFLANVCRLNIEQIEQNIKDLGIALDVIKIQLPNTQDDIKQQMTEFLQNAENEMTMLKNKFEEIKCLRITMANYFCEEEAKFKLDECFEIFHKFCEQFKQAVKENKERLELEIKEEKKIKLKAEEMAKKALKGKNHTFPMKSRGRLGKKHLNNINCSLIQAEANNTNIFMNSKNNEDELMAYLETANEESLQKIAFTRLSKRSPISMDHFQRERGLCSVSLLENNEKNPLGNKSILKTEALEKQNVIQKSWKRLMQKNTASKCQTPEITPNLQKLKILIRSNSTVDTRTGLLRKTPSVIKITKTCLPQTNSVFNFLPNEIKNYQDACNSGETQNFGKSKCVKTRSKVPLTLKIPKGSQENHKEINTPLMDQESSFELQHPRMSLKTVARPHLARRFSSINDEDLRKTLKSLRTPTIEGTNFCFSPVRDLPAKNYLAFSPTLTKPVANIFEDNVTCQDRKDCIENKLEDLKLDMTLDFQENKLKHNDISKEQDVIEEPKEIPEPINIHSKAPCETYHTVLTEDSSLKENQTGIKEENEKLSAIEVLTSNLDSNSFSQQNENHNNITTKKSFSQRMVSKLQNKLRAFSPSRSSSIENLLHSQDNNVITLKESFQTNEIAKNPKSSTEKSIEISETFTKDNNKQNFSQRLVNRLRALSPLNYHNQGVANFQSYVNFKENKSTITSKGATDSIEQPNNNKEDIKIKRKSSCKVNILQTPDNSKTLISNNTNSQQRLSRKSLCSSRSSTSSLNTLHSKTSIIAPNSSQKNIGPRRSSLQYNKNSTDKKVPSSSTSKPSTDKLSRNSPKHNTPRRASLPSSLSSVTSTKLTENRTSLKNSPNKNTNMKLISKKDSLTDNNRTSFTPLKVSTKTQISRRASLPLNRSSITVSQDLQNRRSIKNSKNNGINSKLLSKKEALTNSNCTNFQLSHRASLPSVLKVPQNQTNIKNSATNNINSKLLSTKDYLNAKINATNSIPQNKTNIEKSTDNKIHAKSLSKKVSLTSNKSKISRSKIQTYNTTSNGTNKGELLTSIKRSSTASLSSNSNSLLRKASTPSSHSNSNTELKKDNPNLSKQKEKITSNFIQRRSSLPSNTIRRSSIISVNSLNTTQDSNSNVKTFTRMSASSSIELRKSMGKTSTLSTSIGRNISTTPLRTSVENKNLEILKKELNEISK